MGVLRQDQFLYEDEEILGVAMRGQPGALEGHGREGEDPGQCRRALRHEALRHRGGDHRAARRLRGGGAGRRDPRGPRHPRRGPPPSALARSPAASSCASCWPRPWPASPTSCSWTSPRTTWTSSVDPLAREVPQGLRRSGGRDQSRPPLPGQRLDPHPRRGLPDRDPLPRATTPPSWSRSGRSGSGGRRRSGRGRRRSRITGSSSTGSGPRRARRARPRASCG